jgi:hypothetical protein
MPEFGEVTRIRATTLLVRLCLSYPPPSHKNSAPPPPHATSARDTGADGSEKEGRGGGSRSAGGGDTEGGFGRGLSKSVMRHVVAALFDTLSHTTEVCGAMDPLSLTCLSPLPDLHAALAQACS